MPQGIIENLTEQLMRLPGIGRKSAQRLAFFILSMPEADALAISDAITTVKKSAGFCARCCNIAEDGGLCPICSDTSRNQRILCVVEEPSNIMVIERGGFYRGLYHVLLGSLSPIDGVTPERLKIAELVNRVKEERPEEVIIATNPTTRGEMTAQYIKDVLNPLGLTISRIAYGLPMGGDIEFADEVTLKKSLEGRRKI